MSWDDEGFKPVEMAHARWRRRTVLLAEKRRAFACLAPLSCPARLKSALEMRSGMAWRINRLLRLELLEADLVSGEWRAAGIPNGKLSGAESCL